MYECEKLGEDPNESWRSKDFRHTLLNIVFIWLGGHGVFILLKTSQMNQWRIKLHRSIQDNFLRWSEQFTKAQARIDLIILANHKPWTFFVRGIRVDIDRGQLWYSQESLAKRWKWSRGKVIRFLEILENEQQIVQQTGQQTGQQKDKVITIITIKNYNKFQENDTTNGTTNDTTNGQQTDINNNDNNNKNDKNEKKKKYLDFVFLKDSEYNTLLEIFWQRWLDNAIETLNNYIATKGKDKYKSHYHTIRAWNKEIVEKWKLKQDLKKKPESWMDESII